MTKKPVIKKIKPRGAGTLTESAFWAMIRSVLRNKSRFWKPIALAKLRARRPYKGLNRRRKYEFQCNVCKQWFNADDVNIDHILPVGSLNCKEDLPAFVEGLFCEVGNLQCICTNCHNIKTLNEKL